MKEKYLITGFSGFASYHFINYLNKVCESGTEILGLDCNVPSDFEKWNFSNLDISYRTVDLLNQSAVENAVKEFKPTHILHLAALSSVGKSWGDPAGCFFNNTGIFLNLIEAVRKNDIKCKILCVGSSEEYGPVTKKEIPIKESLKLNPSSPYAVTKFAQESMCECYVNGYGMDIVMTRSFNHIGPRQRDTFVVPSFTKQIAQASLEEKKELEMTTGNISVIRDFLDVRDVVRAYYLLLQNGKSGQIYNISSGKGYSLEEIIRILSETAGIKISTRTDPKLIRANDQSIIIGSNKKIFQDIGWKPEYTIEQSLKDVFEYWKMILSKV